MASYIWIVGQYSKEIPHLEDKLSGLVSQFAEMESIVQSALLTAIVKINLIKPTPKIQKLLQKVLNEATTEIENADVRDKAYIYWRILSTDNTDLQKKVILAKLPVLESTIENFQPILLNQLINEISNLGSVYFKPSSTFLKSSKTIGDASQLQTKKLEELQQMAKSEIVNKAVKAENLLDFDDEEDVPTNGGSTSGSSNGDILGELNDLFAGMASTSSANSQSTNNNNSANNALFDLLGGGVSSGTPSPAPASSNLFGATPAPAAQSTSVPAAQPKGKNDDLLGLF
ncbi:unnamed protein product [Ambrosiozyma monospora]|uniref:Unnamed protein product n=1 Tax=Ambrosiozyma monospora TaxID=43982 RepID=A0ACB5TES1_AMBMO|nr:unnamed protein product [Ambrosiozyma monospora]